MLTALVFLVVWLRQGSPNYGPGTKCGPRKSFCYWWKNIYEKLVGLVECNISQNNHITSGVRPSTYYVITYVALKQRNLETLEVKQKVRQDAGKMSAFKHKHTLSLCSADGLQTANMTIVDGLHICDRDHVFKVQGFKQICTFVSVGKLIATYCLAHCNHLHAEHIDFAACLHSAWRRVNNRIASHWIDIVAWYCTKTLSIIITIGARCQLFFSSWDTWSRARLHQVWKALGKRFLLSRFRPFPLLH